MDTRLNVKRNCALALAALFLITASLACGPSQESPAGDSPSDQVGEDTSGAPQEADTQPQDQPPTATPTEEMPVADGVFQRAPYDPAADLGPPDQYDAFDGQNPLFFERSYGSSSSWYGSDGLYHLTYERRGYWAWYWSDVYGYDFYADLIVINADNCAAGDSGGFVFRGHLVADAGYMFGVTCGGEYFIGLTIIPGSGGLVCWVESSNTFYCEPGDAAAGVVASEYIHAGPGAANRIGVKAEGTTYTFYINGHQVESFTQTTLPLVEGNFALYVGVGQVDEAEVMFDDFSLWDLP